MDRNEQNWSWKRTLISLLLMMAGIIACMSIWVISTDQTCAADINSWYIHYPGAEIVERQVNFMRPNAMGITITTLHTPDSPHLVWRWYIGQLRHVDGVRQVINLATVSWNIQASPMRGGTDIELYAECGNI